jgi:hypothetical protein
MSASSHLGCPNVETGMGKDVKDIFVQYSIDPLTFLYENIIRVLSQKKFDQLTFYLSQIRDEDKGMSLVKYLGFHRSIFENFASFCEALRQGGVSKKVIECYQATYLGYHQCHKNIALLHPDLQYVAHMGSFLRTLYC